MSGMDMSNPFAESEDVVPLRENPTVTIARYDTICPVCDEWIITGDSIVGADGEWIHEECDR